MERVEGGTLRVGIIANAPWVIATGGEPRGVEVHLVREFARELGATPRWVPGPEAELMEALEHSEVDLVIGGLDSSSPWGARVALTRAYHTTRSVVGVPRAAPPLHTAKGVRVAVRSGSPAAAWLEGVGAIAVRVAEPRHTPGPVAGADWELRRWGFRPTQVVLHQHHHVMAAPPGENGWLVRLERFLSTRRGAATRMLEEAR